MRESRKALGSADPLATILNHKSLSVTHKHMHMHADIHPHTHLQHLRAAKTSWIAFIYLKSFYFTVY